jgi:hypothetical protein
MKSKVENPGSGSGSALTENAGFGSASKTVQIKLKGTYLKR